MAAPSTSLRSVAKPVLEESFVLPVAVAYFGCHFVIGHSAEWLETVCNPSDLLPRIVTDGIAVTVVHVRATSLKFAFAVRVSCAACVCNTAACDDCARGAINDAGVLTLKRSRCPWVINK